MGFSKSKRERIKAYILEQIEIKEDQLASKTAETFGVSLTTVYRYLKEMEECKFIERKKGEYILVEETWFCKCSTNEKLEEDEVFSKEIAPHIKHLPLNVFRIWQYAFTEMMNNAIEHSETKNIYVTVTVSYLKTCIVIIDKGVGIFEKICAHFKYNSIDDAIGELFKGKLTTDSDNHSGEGIFFTSRMMETFAALSSGKVFTHSFHDNDECRDLGNVEAFKDFERDKGTKIVMILSNNSKQTTKEVFDLYSDPDRGFVKTKIPIKNFFLDGYPVSRSQARRLCSRFEDFSEVILDFTGVEDLGQGFAHELFNVFYRKHPNLTIKIENANENVRKMIRHVEASLKD